MNKISIRDQKIKDARRFFDILNNPNFLYFLKVKTISDQIDFLKKNKLKRKNNLEYNYTILYGDEIVGGIGCKINQFRKYIGEIGYFVDEKYWGQGIASEAVKLIEQEGLKKLGLSRIEILMVQGNKASQRVAIKNGYHKEGLLKKYIFDDRSGEKQDGWLYAKTF